MRMAILVNGAHDLRPTQTTCLLMIRAVERGHEVWAVDVDELCLGVDGVVRARARPLTATQPEQLLQELRQQQTEVLDLTALSAVLFRTNPGRDPARLELHRSSLDFARLLQRAGVVVLNPPGSLARSSTKLYLNRLDPSLRPASVVAGRPEVLSAFLADQGGLCVMKPLVGSRGCDVMLVGDGPSRIGETPGAAVSLKTALEALLPRGLVLAQQFLTGSVEGDTRVLVLEGRMLEVEGRVAAVNRHPPPGDFRSNIALGGRAAAAQVDERMRRVVDGAGRQLARDGVFLAGLDVVGGRIVEINTWSAGGLNDAQRFEGRDFLSPILEGVERLCSPSPVGRR
jgi:glutathione synthase